MQILLAIILIIIAVALFLSKSSIKNDDLERAANVGGVVATIAAIVVLAFYTTSINPPKIPPPVVDTLTNTLLPTGLPPSPTETPTITLTSTFTPTATLAPTQTNTPTLTSTSTPTLMLPFLDNFDNGIDSHIWKTLSGVWRTIDGRLVADPSRNPSKIIVGDKDWKNYVVEVDVYAMSAAGYPVGIIVRSSNGKSLMFRTDCCDTDWILINGVSEQIIAHVDQGGLEFKLREYVKSHIRVEVIDQTFTGYIDGKQYLQVTDPTTQVGMVGLMSQTPYQNRLVFDDFVVQAP